MGGGKHDMDTLEEGFVKITFSDERSPTAAEAPKETGSGNPLYHAFMDHSSAHRVDTDTHMTAVIKKLHPGAAVVVSRDWNLGLFSFPGAILKPLPDTEILTHTMFFPAAKRGESGALASDIVFGAFTLEWEGLKFIVYILKFTENTYMTVEQFHFVHDSEDQIRRFILACSEHSNALHDEILVFAQGFWHKDHQLWEEVQKANWDDVILAADFKKRVQNDVTNFFKSEKVYRDLAIPWKRGIIFLGPPGNGKTISIKAIMKGCPHPSLLVRSFQSWAGEEAAMQEVFGMARRMSPCIVIFEDLDSLINDRNRSFFLNEIDGLQNNDGLLIIGSTNHFDRLDPALSKRPSRFDRKFAFNAPERPQRVAYAQYWQSKLKSNGTISFPDSLVETFADLTNDFSFAFMKEAFVSTLVILAGEPDRGSFEDVLKEQVKALRDTLDDGHDKDGHVNP
ncbi:hypothetical protein FRC02_006579 [Tulasnella sp. 418]|nr:hypothetical protein FRC02_006579 [Tulasnella sp. 418]